MNDRQRALWVSNDEGLYDRWMLTPLSLLAFVRKYRAEIDEVIDNIVAGRKPPHYLKYAQVESK